MHISIILCTYNRATLLPRAIRSVLRQTVREWELIIIDDGSRDETYPVAQQFFENDERMVYCYQSNRGLAHARNRGLQLASGNVICFVDSDDELAPTHLEQRVRYLQRHPSVDFLYGGMKLIGPKEKQYVVDLTNPKKKIHLSKCYVGGTFFFRKEVLKKVPGFRAIPFGEDFDFYTRVSKRFTVRKVNFPTYLYHLDVENRLCDVYTELLMKKNVKVGQQLAQR